MEVATQKFQMQSLLNTRNYHRATQRANPIQSQYMFDHSSLNLDVLKFSSAASLANDHLLVKWLVGKCHTVEVQNSMHNGDSDLNEADLRRQSLQSSCNVENEMLWHQLKSGMQTNTLPSKISPNK